LQKLTEPYTLTLTTMTIECVGALCTDNSVFANFTTTPHYVSIQHIA